MKFLSLSQRTPVCYFTKVLSHNVPGFNNNFYHKKYYYTLIKETTLKCMLFNDDFCNLLNSYLAIHSNFYVHFFVYMNFIILLKWVNLLGVVSILQSFPFVLLFLHHVLLSPRKASSVPITH